MPSQTAIEKAAQCWCDPRTADRTMDVELATVFAETLDAFEPTPAQAIAALSKAFQADPDYAHSWHCNIAIQFHDCGGDIQIGNEAAKRFMKLAFGVEDYEPKSESPAE